MKMLLYVISAAQRFEHYEISRSTARIAQQVLHSAVALLPRSLAEEENADQLLNQVTRSLMWVGKNAAAIELARRSSLPNRVGS